MVDLVQYNQCIEYLKKAEKLVNQELSFSEGSSKVHSLASVTYNNLACYYKKYIFLVMKDKEAESSAQVSKKKPSSLGEQNQ